MTIAGGNSIINLGDISKPATVLIERISAAVGGIFRPMQTLRVAKAEAEASAIRAIGEADAAKIKAFSELDITDMQQRALARLVHEEGRKQENIEKITAGAIPQLKSDAKPEKMDSDWLNYVFDKCKIVSDEEMQLLWSRILAGEANDPGSFSKRTVQTVTTLEKNDAVQFAALCKFVCGIGTSNEPVVHNPQGTIYNEHGVYFGTLAHLVSVGLIHFEALSGYAVSQLPLELRLRYFDKTTTLVIPNKEFSLDVGKVIFTQTGRELSKICATNPVPGFMEYLIKQMAGHGVHQKADTTQPPPTATS